MIVKKDVAERLQAQLKDAGLKTQLERVKNSLDDVESLFLDNVDESRTPADESRSLGYAERFLQLALMQLQQLEEIVEKYGPDAQTRG